MVDMFVKVVMGILLLICGIQDVLKKKITLWVILLAAAFIGACIPFSQSLSALERFGGILIGVSVIVISLASHGKIGMGDGVLLCATGLGLGFWGNLELFGFALIFAAVISIILLTFRLADRKKSIPFVPFLLLGYVFLIYVQM